MEDCRICFSVVSKSNWKKLSCDHTLCYSCYLKLNQPACPYCRVDFSYTKEDIANREKRKIRYTPYTPPAQLTEINLLDHGFINNLEETNVNYYQNNEIVRINRKMLRRRRRNLTQEEVEERRKNIRIRCRRKWRNKENRSNKIKWYDL